MLLPVLFSLALTLTFSDACSPENFPDGVGFEVTMYEADVVVSGKVKDLNVNNTYGGDKPHVTFTVDCVYKKKTRSDAITGDILINGYYKFNSCTTTYLEQDKRYVMALEDKTEDGTYKVFEYNIASSAAYKSDKVNFAELVEICGFKEPHDVAPGACQMPKSTQECRTVKINAAVTVRVTVWACMLSAIVAFLMK